MRHFARILSCVCTLALLAACSGGGSGPSGDVSNGSGGGTGTRGGGQGGGGGTPALPASGPAPQLPPAGTIYLGAFVNPDGSGNDADNIAHFETQIGRRLALSLHYRGWTSPFIGSSESADAAAGRIPVISWECGTTDARVAAGTEDANIAAHADALRAFAKPVFLRYKWEMNLPAGPGRQQCVDRTNDPANGFFSPSEFVAAWAHIRAIFIARGANNVAFVWNPSGGSSVGPAAYYPGAASVDWVGIDQYDRNDEPFASAYDLYSEVIGYGKPIIVGETGANPTYQSAFLAAAVPALQTQFSGIKGYIYFDAPGKFSWNLTPAGIAAFARMSQAPYLSAR